MTKNDQRWMHVTKALLKGNFSGAIKSLVYPEDEFGVGPNILPGGIYYGPTFDGLAYRGGDPSGGYLATIDGNGYNYFKYAGLSSSLKAYRKCPPVTAIINRKAQAFINGKTVIMNMKGKEATGSTADNLRKLLKRPNPIQSGKQFEAQGYIYQQLFGYSLVLAIKPFGFKKNIDASSLWNIPPSMLDIEETNKLFYQTDQKGMIKQIVLSYKGDRTVLNIDDIFIIKDFTPSFNSLILPESRICSLEMPINNIIGAYESRNVLINYRGALGMISGDPGGGQLGNIPLSPDEKKDLQRQFRQYGLRTQQMQFIITKAALKWQQMGYPTKELMLFEEIEADTQAICDNYNYPYRLMAANTSNSLGGSDAKEFKAMVYHDAIIPEADSICEQWNQALDTESLGLNITKDFSAVPVLQEDKTDAGRARMYLNQALLIEWQNNLITWNQWQEAIGNDTKPNMDIYYTDMVKAGNIFGAQPLTPKPEAINETTTATSGAAPAAAA